MDDRSEGKANDRWTREPQSDKAVRHPSFSEQYSRSSQVARETSELQATAALWWRPCPYCGHGYRNNTTFERHLEKHHGPELRVQGAIRGRLGGAER